MTGPIARAIEDKLTAALAPVRLRVEDQSAAHRGHAGAAGRTETHFRVDVVSAAFAGLSRVARERCIHDILAAELSERVHALSVSARTPEEERPYSPSGPGSEVWGFRDAQREKRKAEKAKKEG